MARPGAGLRRLAGRAAGGDAGTGALLGQHVRLAQVRGPAAGAAALRDRDRRPRHPLHPRPLESRARAAGHHHARLARLGHRAATGHRPAHQPHRARRQRRRRLRRGDPVDTGLRVLGQAARRQLDPRPHRVSLGRADEAPGLHALRRAGRRLGRRHHRRDGRQGATGTARHPLQHARRHPARGGAGDPLRHRRPGAGRPVGRGAEHLGADQLPVHQGHRLRGRNGHVAADAVRAGGLPRRPGGLDDQPRPAQLRGHQVRLRREAGREPDQGRGPRQRHVLLADEHRGLVEPPLRGERVRLLRRQERLHPGRRDRLPERDLQGAAQLDRAGLPQPGLLQRGRPRRSLRRLAGAGAVLRRGAHRVQVATLT
jgi:hypothetical protein